MQQNLVKIGENIDKVGEIAVILRIL